MPARSAFAPGGIPAGFARLFRFPEREIERVTLGFVGIDARAVFQIVDVLPGKLAVTRKTADGEIDVAFRRGISVAFFDQAIY